MKDWWHDFTWKWQRDHPAHSESSGGSSTSTTGTGTSPAPYIPPYEQTPGGNPTSWQAQQNQQQQRAFDEAKKQNDQDIYWTKLEVDRWQRSIEHCTATIADLEAKIADPNVSETEKKNLRGYQDYQRKYLSDAQTNLAFSQKKLAGLTSTALPAPATVTPDLNGLGGLTPQTPMVTPPTAPQALDETPTSTKVH